MCCNNPVPLPLLLRVSIGKDVLLPPPPPTPISCPPRAEEVAILAALLEGVLVKVAERKPSSVGKEGKMDDVRMALLSLEGEEDRLYCG